MVSGRLKTRLWLEVDGRFVIGDGGVQLLLGVRRDGSLAAAVRRIGWSYRHAWGYLRRAEAALGAPLTTARAGKGRAGGAVLTGLGERVVAQLPEARARIDDAVGPSGPTRREIAARGRVSRRLPPPAAPRSARTGAGRTSRPRRS
jgi:molybdate transport system regulatory protein